MIKERLKRTTCTVAFLGMAFGASAQEADSGNRAIALGDSTQTTASQAIPDGAAFGSVMEYQGYDGGWGRELNFRYKYVLVDFDNLSGETNSTITENSGWNIIAGGNYRQWFGKWFYVEGSAGLDYFHRTIETRVAYSTTRAPPNNFGASGSATKYTYQKDKNGEFGLFVNPRVGVKLFNFKSGGSMGLTASYRRDFLKFKFKKANTTDYFTVGIAFNG